jgi:hypothetical protein
VEVVLELRDGVFTGLELILKLFGDEGLKLEFAVESDEFLLELFEF